MKFTKYIWDLYKISDRGRKEISLFKTRKIQLLSDKFEFDIVIEFENDNGLKETFSPYNEMIDELEDNSINNFLEAKKLFNELIIENVKKDKFNFFFEYLGAITTALYHVFPDYFIPFYYNRDNYPDFLRLCENFGIILPNNPPRNDWVKRTWFYFDICEILHQFRRDNDIDSKEFPAFLYYFGLRSLEKLEEEDLPKPSRIYFLGAGGGFAKEENNWDFQFLDNSDYGSSNTWGAGSLNIKKGDLVLMYCLSPRKYLHSIWRALDDSFVDPFAYYYFGIKIGFPQKIPHIGFQELKNNPILGENPSIKIHMQGLNGRPLTVKQYSELLKIIKKKGRQINDLPKLPIYDRVFDNIENERDVERFLIEPLLKDLNFKEKDWIRQLPIRMGRQTKYYPDYAILTKITKGREKAKIILEAKYSINSDKQLSEAFFQARSYGLRLQSEKIVLADMDFVWLFEKSNGDFEQKPILKFHWNELNNSDNLYKLKNRLRR